MATHPLTGIDPIIAEARERWPLCEEGENKQRARIVAAKQFRAGDQWPAAIKTAREGQIALQGVAAQPPRPCLTIDRLAQPVRQVSNQIKAANFAIDVAPNGSGADIKTAEIFKGYLRRVQNQARGESPIEWAADGAIEGGLGWFRLLTEFVNESPEIFDHDTLEEVFDQELRLGRITNNLSVYCDPAAVKPTRSDAQFMFVTEDLPKSEFERRWTEDVYGDPVDLRGLEDFSTTGDPGMKAWVGEDSIRIAEYWTITYTEQKWAVLKDGSIQQVKEFPKDAKQTRLVRKPVVTGYKITACQILEKWDWLGSRIPLIPILGEELNIDGQVVLRGMIEEGMDAQRMVNYTYSGAMEIYALGGKDPIIAAAGQIDPYKQIWDTSNAINYSYLPYEPITIGGQLVERPRREGRSAPIEASVALMQVSEEAIKATTGFYDSGLGSHDGRVLSGRAKQSEIQQSELGSSNYGDSVQRALVYAGELMVEIIPKLTRPGQIVHIIGQDDKPEAKIIGQHFVSQGGQPQPVDPAAIQDPSIAEFYDLTKGRYGVTVIVGKANATKREEGAAAVGELIPHLPPEMAAVVTPEYIEQLDFPNAHKIAEMARKALPPQLQQQDENQSPLPPAVQAQIQGMQQQLQQLMQEKQTEEWKQQGMLKKAQIDAHARLQERQLEISSREKIALIQASTQWASTEAKINAEDARTFVDAGLNKLGKALELHMAELGRAHELLTQQHDQAHQVGTLALEHAHDVQMADQAHQQALEQGQQGHQQALEAGVQAAALQPPADTGGAA